jgi:hypothetical protein
MRVVVEQQTHNVRRELVILCTVVAIGVLTVLVLLVPTLVR